LRLLAETAKGGVIASLAREGGMTSTLWAGPEQFFRAMKRGEMSIEPTRRTKPVALQLGFAGDDFGYAIDLGIPVPSRSMFSLDPEIKRERIWAGPVWRLSTSLVERGGTVVRSRTQKGEWSVVAERLCAFDSMMTEFADPRTAPEMQAVRDEIRSWRFYDHFRTDVGAPARLPQIGTHTPVLGHDGVDLAAALQTIREIGDFEALERAVDDAFPGSALNILNHDGRFEVEVQQNGLLRPLKASELSDGTLRYLLLVAALLTPRPPSLLVLNEPETSLHADLLPALGRLIAHAARYSQVVVVSHASRLIAALERESDSHSIVLEKELGETHVNGLRELDMPSWHWPR
jgi:predicted ATPase